jgi:hypothetical protein
LNGHVFLTEGTHEDNTLDQLTIAFDDTDDAGASLIVFLRATVGVGSSSGGVRQARTLDDVLQNTTAMTYFAEFLESQGESIVF